MLLDPIPSFYRGTISVPPMLAKLAKTPHCMQKKGEKLVLTSWEHGIWISAMGNKFKPRVCTECLAKNYLPKCPWAEAHYTTSFILTPPYLHRSTIGCWLSTIISSNKQWSDPPQIAYSSRKTATSFLDDSSSHFLAALLLSKCFFFKPESFPEHNCFYNYSWTDICHQTLKEGGDLLEW